MTNRLCGVLIIFVLNLMPLISGAQNRSLEYLKQGNLYAKSKQYEQAVELYDLSIKEDAGFYKGYRNKGIALFFLLRYEEAINYFEKALSLKQDDKEKYLVFALMANSFAYLDKPSEAIRNAKKSISLNNKNPINYEIKGDMLGLLKMYTDALVAYDKAISLNPKSSILYENKFCPLFNLGRYDEALETCNKAIELGPNKPNIHKVYANKGLALNKLGRYKEALESADKALELNAADQTAIKVRKEALKHLEQD